MKEAKRSLDWSQIAMYDSVDDNEYISYSFIYQQDFSSRIEEAQMNFQEDNLTWSDSGWVESPSEEATTSTARTARFEEAAMIFDWQTDEYCLSRLPKTPNTEKKSIKLQRIVSV